MKTIKVISKTMEKLLSRYSFHNLLVWLLVYLVVGPFITGDHTKLILSIFMSMIFFFAVCAINYKSGIFRYVLLLMGITLILYWLALFNMLSYSNIASKVMTTFYICLLIYAFSKYVLTEKKITSRLISATLCLYLFIGTLWGMLYDMLETISPGSYKGTLLAQTTDMAVRQQHFQYFSFVTLTTLGYGDILPMTEGATALCKAEAIIGQFFMAVLVARLVGIQVAQQFGENNNENSGGGN